MRLWPFYFWLLLFYGVWLALVISGDLWHVLREHWGIAVAMSFGSYVAGSTPMGGGTVGFPILVLAFHEPAVLGRDFSFAVQSIGMTSASIFILSRRQQLEWALVGWAMIGSLVGTPLGILLISPLVPGLVIKVLFAVVWGSFGVLHLRRTNEICAHVGETPAAHRFDRNVGLGVGFFSGAMVVAITGVGIDMMLYAVMVLLMRADLKLAVPSSVIIMAFNSVIGILTKILFTGVRAGVFENWLAAAPIVVLGAPLGAWIVAHVGRKSTLWVVAVLCVGQFGWTMKEEFESLGWVGVTLALAAVMTLNSTFEWLWGFGNRLARRSGEGKL